MHTARTALAVALAGLLALGAQAPALAATPAHDHAQAAAAPTALTLDHGRKWTTDAPLRQRMGEIRALLAPRLGAIHRGTLTAADYRALGAAFDHAVAAPGSPLERLGRAFVAHVDFVAANPGVPRALFHELQSPGDSAVRVAVRETVGGYRARLEALVREAKACGELPARLDAGLASALFIGAVQALTIEASLTGDLARMRRRAGAAFALLCDGYRGAGGARG